MPLPHRVVRVMSEAVLAVFAATWACMWITEAWRHESITRVRASTAWSLCAACVAVGLFVVKFVQSQPTVGEWGIAGAMWGLCLLHVCALAFLRHRERSGLGDRRMRGQVRRSAVRFW